MRRLYQYAGILSSGGSEVGAAEVHREQRLSDDSGPVVPNTPISHKTGEDRVDRIPSMPPKAKQAPFSASESVVYCQVGAA